MIDIHPNTLIESSDIATACSQACHPIRPGVRHVATVALLISIQAL